MAGNKWQREPAPPPPMFLGEKERNLVKQVNDELSERVIGKQVFYFPIDQQTTNYHSLYGEAIHKNFLPPIRVYAMVHWEGQETSQSDGMLDKRSKLSIFFHKRRLSEDQDLYVREGDFVKYGGFFYEITELSEDRELWGQINHLFEIKATCIKSRKGNFDAT